MVARFARTKVPTARKGDSSLAGAHLNVFCERAAEFNLVLLSAMTGSTEFNAVPCNCYLVTLPG